MGRERATEASRTWRLKKEAKDQGALGPSTPQDKWQLLRAFSERPGQRWYFHGAQAWRELTLLNPGPTWPLLESKIRLILHMTPSITPWESSLDLGSWDQKFCLSGCWLYQQHVTQSRYSVNVVERINTGMSEWTNEWIRSMSFVFSRTSIPSSFNKCPLMWFLDPSPPSFVYHPTWQCSY